MYSKVNHTCLRYPKNTYQTLYRLEPNKSNNLELFISSIENKPFNTNSIRKSLNNLRKHEKLALNKIKSWKVEVIRAQAKGSTYLALNIDNYLEKVEQQINRRKFF